VCTHFAKPWRVFNPQAGNYTEETFEIVELLIEAMGLPMEDRSDLLEVHTSRMHNAYQ
jgi:cobalamin biosynthesis Mg chelatase CobN